MEKLHKWNIFAQYKQTIGLNVDLNNGEQRLKGLKPEDSAEIRLAKLINLLAWE